MVEAHSRQRSRHLSRGEMEELAEQLVKLGSGPGNGRLTFMERLASRLEQKKISIPSVTVEVRNLSVEADAVVGSQAIPSLTNAALQAVTGMFSKLTCAPSEKKQMHILKGISGVFKPGRMSLVLGAPGSGKSVLLKALAGRLKAQNSLKVSGSIRYNGAQQNEFIIERTTAHVEQLDNHLGTMSVHETLTFAHRCQVGYEGPDWNLSKEFNQAAAPLNGQRHAEAGANEQELDDIEHGETANLCPGTASASLPAAADLPDDEFDAFIQKIWGTAVKVEAIIKFLGLERCKDTMVGDSMTRGISGGEKKRLTSAEMLVGPKTVLLMDDISTGLDSATLFSVIKWLRQATHSLRLTTIITLLQPPPETFMQFDDILMLAEGHSVFHGPVSQAVPFFTSLGFQCPVRKDSGSFLQEVTTPIGQRQYAGDDLKRSKGIALDAPPPEADDPLNAPKELLISLEEIGDAYWNTSEAGQVMKASLDQPFAREESHPKALVNKKYAMSPLQAIWTLTLRQMMITARDKILARGRMAQVVIVGLLIGSLYWDLERSPRGALPFFGVMFIMMLFMSLGALPQLFIVLQNKPVFFKHQENFFYSSVSYVYSIAITQIPFSFMEATVFSLITYFMVGLSTDSAKYFFMFWLILFLSNITATSVFRLVACAFPNAVIAFAVAGTTLLMLMATAGFTITRQSIPGWWIWAYWISPFAYGYRALAINEMTSPSWGDFGTQALDILEFHTDRKWIWIGAVYLIAAFFVCTTLSAIALHYRREVKKHAVIIDKDAVEHARKLAWDRRQRMKKRIEQEGIELMVDAEKGTAGGMQEYSVSRALPFEPITIVYKNIRYFVDVPKQLKNDKRVVGGKLQLLQGITGYARPGSLDALMGGTGAGKTTLMDVLAGRKTTGVIEGELLVNGYPKEQKTWSRVVGYVEQTDSHSPAVTVREALEFSARLRLDTSVTYDKAMAVVDEVLSIVDLTDIQHSIVGVKGLYGLSYEQRKRLSIAVELVANPSVVFMDEPTTGLDARAASTVIRAVKNVALNGRTVIVTIHQPSIDIFETFDNLMLIQMGGSVIYFGPLGHESTQLIQYLQSIPHVPKLQPGYNPSTWMLECTGGAMTTMVDAVDEDFTAAYQDSELFKINAAEAERLCTSLKERCSPLKLSTVFAVPPSLQAKVLLHKFFVSYWRSPAYNLVRMIMTAVVALVFGSLYYGEGDIPRDSDGTTEVANVQNIMGVLFVAMSFMGMTNLITVLPVVAAEREVYYKERAASMYQAAPYALASGLVELPYLAAQALVFTPIVYFMIQFEVSFEKIVFFFIMFLESLSLYTFYGQMLVYLTPVPEIAQVLGAFSHFVWTLFNGFLIAESEMPRGWRWMNTIVPTTYIVHGLTASELGDNNAQLSTFAGNLTVSQFIKDRFDFDHSFRWWCVGIMFLFIVVVRVLTVVAVTSLNYQRR
ncbi:unnamed protein product [Ostreobium quekettii]|uniref:ABC transporter domain-containing protein n=1 Tax=Ostreobium quekettii TaxID=121088 RepID=A0A8S1J4T9_9CHLO|nr:unnamed protein product [Ostreobium quekettii]